MESPNFDIVTSGPVSFGCAYGGVFPACDPLVFLISGTAPASGMPIGSDGTFTTNEHATPISATENQIDGHAVLTAQNGDEIHIHYEGTSPAPTPDETGVGHLNDDLPFTITGGTGRYSDAEGEGRLIATGPVYYDGRPTIVASELKGTIRIHDHDGNHQE